VLAEFERIQRLEYCEARVGEGWRGVARGGILEFDEGEERGDGLFSFENTRRNNFKSVIHE
jgi:hypothetical protein